MTVSFGDRLQGFRCTNSLEYSPELRDSFFNGISHRKRIDLSTELRQASMPSRHSQSRGRQLRLAARNARGRFDRAAAVSLPRPLGSTAAGRAVRKHDARDAAVEGAVIDRWRHVFFTTASTTLSRWSMPA